MKKLRSLLSVCDMSKLWTLLFVLLTSAKCDFYCLYLTWINSDLCCLYLTWRNSDLCCLYLPWTSCNLYSVLIVPCFAVSSGLFNHQPVFRPLHSHTSGPLSKGITPITAWPLCRVLHDGFAPLFQFHLQNDWVWILNALWLWHWNKNTCCDCCTFSHYLKILILWVWLNG